MSKINKIIILSVLILILAVAGYLLYNKWQESKMGLVSFEKVQEQTIDGKTYIENKEVGLKFAVPDGWEVTKDRVGLSMHSPDFVPFTDDSFFIPKNGCWIETTSEILKNDQDFDWEYGDLKLMISNQNYLLQKNNDDKNKLEVVEVAGLKGIKSSYLSDTNPNNVGNFLYVAIPQKNLLYVFTTYIFGEKKELCLQEFDTFLTTINIKK